MAVYCAQTTPNLPLESLVHFRGFRVLQRDRIIAYYSRARYLFYSVETRESRFSLAMNIQWVSYYGNMSFSI